MRKAILVTVVAILLSVTAPDAVAEVYTALADMEELLETEAVLIDMLSGYITAQEQRLATLRRWVGVYRARGFRRRRSKPSRDHFADELSSRSDRENWYGDLDLCSRIIPTSPLEMS